MTRKKDAILITSHTPDSIRKTFLVDLVRSINKEKYDIVISANSEVPLEVFSQANFVFFDKENILITDYDKKIELWWANENFRVCTTEVKNFNHIAAAARLITNGLSICKTLGYQKVHFLEYDSKIVDHEVFEKNSYLLDKYSFVWYNHPSFDGLFSSYSLNLNKVPSFWFDLDMEKLYEYLSEEKNNRTLEEYGLKLIQETPNSLQIDLEEYSKNVVTNLFNSDHVDDWAVVVGKEDRLYGFAINKSDKEDSILKVLFVINEDRLMNTNCKKGFWSLTDLGKLKEIQKISIFANGVLKSEYDYSAININKFIERNYIRKA